MAGSWISRVVATVLVLVASSAQAQIRTQHGGTGQSLAGTDNTFLVGKVSNGGFVQETVTGTCSGATNFLRYDTTAADGGRLSCDAAARTKTYAFALENPAAADDHLVQIKVPSAETIAEVYCSTDSSTANIDFDIRANATPNTSGTNVIDSGTTGLACDTDGETKTSTWNDNTLTAGQLLSFFIESVGTPGVVRVTVKSTVD